jgi:hypothetical protein
VPDKTLLQLLQIFPGTAQCRGACCSDRFRSTLDEHAHEPCMPTF